MIKRPIISVKNLNKSFKVGKNNIHILKDINLDINEGEFVIIFGPSGCGKSTLLNSIVGLERPNTGQVLIKNQDIYQEADDKRAIFRQKNIGMVHQQPNWLKVLNVIENVEFPLHIGGMSHHRAKRRAKNILNLLGVDEYEKYTPTELSGGQQQKVAMARALVSNPLIIIADEPTGNLDSISASDVMNIFKYIGDESGRTILMVSHNLEYEKFADKVVFMRDGQVEKITDKSRKSAKTGEKKDLLEMALEENS